MKRLMQRIIVIGAMALAISSAGAGLSSPPVDAAQALTVTKEEVFLLPVPIHNVFNVVEVLTLHNASTENQDVQVYVPAGATGLSVNQQTYAGQKATDGATVVPGAVRARASGTVTIAYSLPFDAQTGAQFALRTPYAVDVAHLYLPIGNTAVSAQGLLTTTQTANISGTQCRVFTRLGIPAGDEWSISLQQLPTATPSLPTQGLPVLGSDPSDGQNLLQAIGNLVLAVIVLAVGLVSIRSTQHRSLKQSLSSTEALYRALENNEVEWDQGMLDEQVYRKRRRELVDKLVRMHSSE